MTADVVVSGMGGLHILLPGHPRPRRLPGRRPVPLAEWDHDHDPTGERGGRDRHRGVLHSVRAADPARGPEAAPVPADPALDHALRDRRITDPEHAVYRRSRNAQLAMRAAIYWARETFAIGFMHPRYMEKMVGRVARAYLQKSVPDPEPRRKLTPDYTIGCKRVLISNDYYLRRGPAQRGGGD